MTVHMEQRSYRGDRFDLVLNKQYVSQQQQVQRRLITPDEAMRLPDDDALILVAGHPPIRATKIRYYEDQILGKRARVPPPIAADAFKPDGGAWPSLPADEDQEPWPKIPSASPWS